LCKLPLALSAWQLAGDGERGNVVPRGAEAVEAVGEGVAEVCVDLRQQERVLNQLRRRGKVCGLCGLLDSPSRGKAGFNEPA
jgi:hypothetical protein